MPLRSLAIVERVRVRALLIGIALLLAALPTYATAAKGGTPGPAHMQIVRLAPPGGGVIGTTCEVASGVWLRVNAGGWGATTAELRQLFIDNVPVSLTIDGVVVGPLEHELSTATVEWEGADLFLYFVRHAYTSHPLAVGSHVIRKFAGPAPIDIPDGIGPGIGFGMPAGESFWSERTVVVTPRGRFPATSLPACS